MPAVGSVWDWQALHDAGHPSEAIASDVSLLRYDSACAALHSCRELQPLAAHVTQAHQAGLPQLAVCCCCRGLCSRFSSLATSDRPESACCSHGQHTCDTAGISPAEAHHPATGSP